MSRRRDQANCSCHHHYHYMMPYEMAPMGSMYGTGQMPDMTNMYGDGYPMAGEPDPVVGAGVFAGRPFFSPFFSPFIFPFAFTNRLFPFFSPFFFPFF